MEFDSVIAPMTRADFLRDYWNKMFVRIAGTPGRFGGLTSWDELDAILEQHRLVPPRIKLYQDGRALDPQRYFTPAKFGVPRLDAGGLAVCIAQGATLVLDDVQELAPRIGVLTQSFQDALGSDVFANLYASWHGQNGFDLHWDPQASLILQLAGRKRWQIYKPTRTHPLEGEAEPPTRPAGSPLWDGVLEDGDTLYIPRGWWHVAYPLNEPSLHLTVSLTPPKGLDFLSWVLRRLRAEEAARADLPALGGEAELAARIEVLRALLDAQMTAVMVADFLREWQANIRPSPHIRLQHAPYEQLATLTANSRIRLAALHRLFFTTNGAMFECAAAGRLWNVPPEIKPALEGLSNTRWTMFAELSALLSDSAAVEKLHKSIDVLARAGVVLVQKG